MSHWLRKDDVSLEYLKVNMEGKSPPSFITHTRTNKGFVVDLEVSVT